MAEARNSERLIMFSDGVIAIAVTLLVLDIRLPVEDAGKLSNSELFAALVATLPRIYAYVLSFVVVGLYWTSHHQKFAVIPRVDGVITWLNVAFLLLIGLVPFVTAVLAENGDAVATAVYAALMAAMGVFLALIWGYAWKAGMISNAVDEARKRRVFALSVAAVVVFIASIGVAFLNNNAAKFCWLALIPISLARFAAHRGVAGVEDA